MLKTKFKTLCQNFSKDEKLINTLWKEIKIAYSQPNRHYHTLKHLEQFYIELVLIDTVTAFAIFYHDIVYDASRNDNEEKSATLSNKICANCAPESDVGSLYRTPSTSTSRRLESNPLIKTEVDFPKPPLFVIAIPGSLERASAMVVYPRSSISSLVITSTFEVMFCKLWADLVAVVMVILSRLTFEA